MRANREIVGCCVNAAYFSKEVDADLDMWSAEVMSMLQEVYS